MIVVSVRPTFALGFPKGPWARQEKKTQKFRVTSAGSSGLLNGPVMDKIAPKRKVPADSREGSIYTA